MKQQPPTRFGLGFGLPDVTVTPRRPKYDMPPCPTDDPTCRHLYCQAQRVDAALHEAVRSISRTPEFRLYVQICESFARKVGL